MVNRQEPHQFKTNIKVSEFLMENVFLSNTFQVEVWLINIYHTEDGEWEADKEDDGGEDDVQAVPLVAGQHPGGSTHVDVSEGNDSHRKYPVDKRNWVGVNAEKCIFTFPVPSQFAFLMLKEKEFRCYNLLEYSS